MELALLQHWQGLFYKAEELKQQVQAKYDEALKYTFPSSNAFYDISNDTINNEDHSEKIYNDVSIEVSETLANQMELSLTKDGDTWIGFGVKDYLNRVEDTIKCREKTQEVFENLHNSNMQQQISYSYKDFILGTTCLKINFRNTKKGKVINYKHLNIGRVYILENGCGKVDTTFYKIKDYNGKRLREMLGQPNLEIAKEIEYDASGEYKTFDVIELCIPDEKGKWDYAIVDEGFNQIFFSKKVKHNPFIVARFKKNNDIGVWGIGKAIERLSLIKNLQFFSKILMRVVDRDSSPPYLAETPNTKQPDLSLSPNKILWTPVGTKVVPLFSNVDINSLTAVIQGLEIKLKEAFLVDAILEAQAQNTYKTAYEVSLGNQKFLDKFATYASSIQNELPKELFIRSYEMLVEENLIEKLDIDDADIIFNNQVIINQKTKEVDKLIQGVQIAIGVVGQDAFLSSVQADKIVPWIFNNLNIDLTLLNTPKESEEILNKVGDMRALQSGIGGIINSEGLGGPSYG